VRNIVRGLREEGPKASNPQVGHRCTHRLKARTRGVSSRGERPAGNCFKKKVEGKRAIYFHIPVRLLRRVRGRKKLSGPSSISDQHKEE